MSGLLAACGWGWALVAGADCLALRRRLELVARAEHELRGPVGVLSLAHERGQAQAAGTELERLRAGLGDLAAAREGARQRGRLELVELSAFVAEALGGWRGALSSQGREASIDWRAGGAWLLADRGRLAQIVGNLLANAAEHGRGEVQLRARRTSGGVRLEVRNGAAPGTAAGPRRPEWRGRGLSIAAGAAEALGGQLGLRSEGLHVVAAVDLPLEPEGRAA